MAQRRGRPDPQGRPESPPAPAGRAALRAGDGSQQADAGVRAQALSVTNVEVVQDVTIGNGDILIAAITSCTNTSNPGVMLAAGLLAKKAVEQGLRVAPHIKTSLAPGSRMVTEYLRDANRPAALSRATGLSRSPATAAPPASATRATSRRRSTRRSARATWCAPRCFRATATSRPASIPTSRPTSWPARRWWSPTRSPARC